MTKAPTARLWTGKGDDGTTGLLYGGRAPKASRQIEAVGAVDEAQASIGLARAELRRGSKLDKVLIRVERELWVLMAELATGPRGRSKLVDGESRVTEDMVRALEADTDAIGSRLELSPEFVVPGQNRPSALLDVARTVVRRAERAAQPVLIMPGGYYDNLNLWHAYRTALWDNHHFSPIGRRQGLISLKKKTFSWPFALPPSLRLALEVCLPLVS